MYLGLDLRGGVHFLLQVDMKAALAKKMEASRNDIRSALRDKRIQYTGVTREGPGDHRCASATARCATRRWTRSRAPCPISSCGPSDDGAEFRIVATLKPEAQRQAQDFALQQNITTLRNRVNELGVAEPIIQQQGADRVVVQLPGVQDTAKAKDILGRTATLEVRMVEDEAMQQPGGAAGGAGGAAALQHRALHRARRRSRSS